MDQAQFLQQLQIILNPSQGNVKEATNTLQKVYYKNPEALLFLIQIATTHHDADLKQLAAVEARSLAIKLWGKVPDAQKPQVREQLLRSTLSESSALVRHACARVISAIAEIDLTDGEWADLPQFLLNASTSAKAEERAVGTYILFAILETLGEGFEEKFMDLFALFEKTIRDPESAEVRINTLLALSKLAVHLDSDEDEKPVKAFQQIFPAMVNVLKDTIDQGDDARIMQAFEVYQTLLGCDPELLNPHLKDLVIFMNEISANTKASDDTRTQAISFLMQAVSYRKIRIQGMQLGDQLTRTCLAIATELDSLDSDEDDITPARSALGLLDMMSQSFAPSQVVVPLLTAVGQYFNSSDASHRRAGIMSLGMCIDGAPDFISTQMHEIFPVLFRLLQDPEASVRQATLDTVARLADVLPDDVSKQHQTLMPLLLKNLASAMQEYNGDESSPAVDMIKSSLSATDTNYVGPLMQASEEALHLDHSRLKESTYLFWGVMSKVYGSEFTPYLEGVVKALITCLEQNETEMEVSLGDAAKDLVGQEVTIAGHKVRVAGADDNDDDDDDEFEDVDDWENLNTVTPVSLEKEIAIEVLGDVITHTGKSFMPFFEMTMQHILPLTEHSYEGVRKSAMSTLHRSYAALWQVCEETGQMQKWQPGKNMPLSEPPNELKKLGEILMKVTLQRWAEEDDPSAISDINRNFADNLRFCGPYLISNRENLEKVTSLVTSIITKQHPCQLDIDATEEDREMMEELSEFDWNVIDTALDVVSGLAIALGAEFVALWPAFEKYVLRFAASSESLERSTSIGVLADVISGLGNAITPYTGNFFRLFTHRLTDEDMQTRSNTCYAVGMLVEKSEADAELVAAYPTILEKVTRCLQIQQARLPDNAAGCVARLIIKHHENVPLEEVLPALVDILPLQNDFDENEPIYRMICQLYKWENPTISQLTPRLLPIFESVLTGDSDQLDDERRAELIELVKWINKMQPGGAAAFVEKLSS
ncbi:importin beta-4 subunit [Trichophyton equinum CBS 127.97]|uniref:Importin beta-4 subunit n=1 Tax=Trichophyton equinum (strain ATCC MYA-4606 / CBS 127.97) TaxID=559882 RepID=F2PP72_TRIEC|nr:importin beta-4 subunit [Trichophyton equinum CBS 127.97]